VFNGAQIESHTAAIEKTNAGIRDLGVVSRTLVDALQKSKAQLDVVTYDIERLSRTHNELREMQKVTEDKLHALIETLDRIIRSQQK
jgi:hypothetical protein